MQKHCYTGAMNFPLSFIDQSLSFKKTNCRRNTTPYLNYSYYIWDEEEDGEKLLELGKTKFSSSAVKRYHITSHLPETPLYIQAVQEILSFRLQYHQPCVQKCRTHQCLVFIEPLGLPILRLPNQSVPAMTFSSWQHIH